MDTTEALVPHVCSRQFTRRRRRLFATGDTESVGLETTLASAAASA
jgi:hypothetical protein